MLLFSINLIRIILIPCLFLFGIHVTPAYSQFLGEDDGFISSMPHKTPKKKPSPPKKSRRSPRKRPAVGPGPVVKDGSVQPMTALRYLDSFNEQIGLNDDQVYMAMGIIKQESWFKVGAKNKATTILMNHEGLYDSDACVGLGQLMAVAIQDMIQNKIIPLDLINSDPEMRDDFSILKKNIVPGKYRGKRVYRYAQKAVIVLVTNPKLSLVLAASFIKRTDDLLERPNLTGKWYNGLIAGQQLKAIPMTYNAGIGRAKNALEATFGKRIVENVAPNLTGGADRMYYAKVTKFAKKFKEMKVYDVAVSLNKSIGLRAITKKEKKEFSGKKKGMEPEEFSKTMREKEAIAEYLNLEENMSFFLTFDDDAGGNEDFIGTWTLNDEEMKEFRKGLLFPDP